MSNRDESTDKQKPLGQLLAEANDAFEQELDDYMGEWEASLRKKVRGDAKPPPKEKRWVTLDPSSTHVNIDGQGNITAGPASMTGKPINRLSSTKPSSPKTPNRFGRGAKPTVPEKPEAADTDEPETAAPAPDVDETQQPEGSDHADRDQGGEGGSGQDDGGAEDVGGGVAEAPGRSGDEGAGGGRPAGGGSSGAAAAGRVPASKAEVNRRLDRFSKTLRAAGQHEAAGWMDMLKQHVEAVGTDEMLKSLGEERAGGGEEGGVDYEGGWSGMSDFCRSYLDRVGITAAFGPTGSGRTLISSASPSQHEPGEGDERLIQPVRDPYLDGDFKPADPTFKDKLEESKALPGLEKSEDIGKLMGRTVEAITPDVTAKMDEVYGKGQWIIKTYGDDAYAGFGVFFPQRVEQLKQDAQNTLWSAGENLSKYGFELMRDKDDKVVGLKHEGGDEYPFDSDKYRNTIHGDARAWGDRAAGAAPNEKGPALLDREGKPMKEFMAQPAFKVVGISDAERAAGMTIKQGQEGRVHIVTRNGKAELVRHSTWLKGEHLPVVFENEDTRAMAQAAVDAINALPESERRNQIYAPDVVKTEDGYKVVEANPANATGSSGYLGDNPFIVDAYVSQLTGREPAHVKFIRRLLSQKGKGGKGKGKSARIGVRKSPKIAPVNKLTRRKGK